MTSHADSASVLAAPHPARRRAAIRSGLGTAMLLGGLLGIVACDSESTTDGTVLEARSAVGLVEGTDIVISALLDGDDVALYQCGGETTFDTHTAWFRGTIGEGDDPDAFELSAAGMTVIGTRDEMGLSGRLTDADGNEHDFRVDAVDDDAEAGVYVAEDYDEQVGVIVLPDNGGLRAQGASCTRSSPCDQVIILSPLTITNGAIAVQVDTDGDLRDFQVQRTLTAPDPL